jgi:hypothetical protein
MPHELHEGRIPLSDAETEAVDALLTRHSGAASLTRRDPGETGPVLVHIGETSWQVDEEGRVEAAS